MEKLTVNAVAAICHEANRQYCIQAGLDAGSPWTDLSADEQKPTLMSVEHLIKNPDVTPKLAHDTWVKDRLDAGWTFGETRDDDNKVHNLLVDYDQLAEGDRVKDELILGVVNSLRPMVASVSAEDNKEDDQSGGNYVDPKPFAHADGTPVGSALAEALNDIEENPPEGRGDSLLEDKTPVGEDAPGLAAPKNDGVVEGQV